MESIYRGVGHTLGSFLGGLLIQNLGGMITTSFWWAGWIQFLVAVAMTILSTSTFVL